MFKSFFLSIIVFAFILSDVILPQKSNSFQVTGGIITPINSSKGIAGLIQYNYSLNEKFAIYFYSGYSVWDKYRINIRVGGSQTQKSLEIQSYSSSDHKLIPLYLGTRINLHTNKLFTSYLNFELGYSHLTYKSYTNMKLVDPTTGEIVGYSVAQSPQKDERENLFGVGVGIGLSRQITNNSSLLLATKLNSFLNPNKYGLLSAKGTYLMVLAGIDFSI